METLTFKVTEDEARAIRAKARLEKVTVSESPAARSQPLSEKGPSPVHPLFDDWRIDIRPPA